MNEDRDATPSGPPSREPPGDDRLARLAARLGVELPPFPGPLVAFDPAEERSHGDPIYLGGDLHAVHPEARIQRPGADLDHTLDAAEIVITNFEHEPVETMAVEGVWCLALQGPILDSAPYLAITDTEGLHRTWILLPPPLRMIGIGHYWLPAVAPAAGIAPRRRGPGR
jgi:hypothetical protein